MSSSKSKSYTAIAFDFRKGKWILVTEKPVPRVEVVQIVAAQWSQGRTARAIPVG